MKKTCALLLLSCLATTGCFNNKVVDHLNPFEDEGPPKENLGDTSNKTLLEETSSSGQSNAATARAALEVMAKYREAQASQPAYPVMQPAEVRLMWVPDHTNHTGDLVPAHYYYLKVLDDRWAVQDAFDLEQQLNVSTKGEGGSGGATPWVYGDPSGKK